MKLSVSAVISAFNEEKNIRACLESVKWCDEIVVVDNESTDGTASIAKEAGAKVFSAPNNLMLNVNKNFGFEKASSDWILNLDADERITPELKDEIQSVISQLAISNQKIDGYWLPRKNIIFGKWIEHSLWFPDEQLRLFKKGSGKFPEKHIHEYLEVKGETGHLTKPLLHENYQSISQFITKMNGIYTENEVENLMKGKKELRWQDALKMPASDFNGNYFSKEGYKDGLHGLVLNILQAFYSGVVFAKFWEKKGFPENEIPEKEINKVFRAILKETDYWLWEVKIHSEKNPLKKVMYKVLRKI